MKTILKYFLLLIALSLVGLVIYQNLDYFLTRNALTIHIEKFNWTWTTPAIENVVYFDICFLAGLLLSSCKGLLVKWDLNKTIKSKENEIKALHERITELKTELNVFQHDPYIKKGLEKRTQAQTPDHPEALPGYENEKHSENEEQTSENTDASPEDIDIKDKVETAN